MIEPVLLLSLLCAPMPAQEPDTQVPTAAPVVAPAAGAPAEAAPVEGRRVRVLGKLEDLEGRPWAGASVRLLAWLDWEYPGFGEPDDLELVSDERGRFRGELLQHRTYLVWGYQRTESGSWRVTPPLSCVRAGEPLVLREAPWQQADVEVGFDCEDWARLGPFRCYATEQRPLNNTYLLNRTLLEPEPAIPLPLVHGKTVALPPLPWPEVEIEIQGEGGLLVDEVSRVLSDGEFHPRQDWTLTPGKPQLREIRLFEDSWNSEPVKDFEVWQRYRGREVRLDMDVEDGVAKLLLPVEDAQSFRQRFWRFERGPQYVLRKQGLADALCVNFNNNYTVRRGKGNVRYKGGRALTGTARQLEGRLCGPDGKPPEGVTLLLWQADRNAGIYPRFHFNQAAVVAVDAEGRFVHDRLGSDPWALLALLPDTMLDGLMGDSKAPIHPLALLATGLGSAKAVHQCRDLRLDQLVRAEIEVDGERRPGARLPRIHLFGDQDTNYGPPRLLFDRVSRRGNLVLLVPPGVGYRFAARSVLGIVHDKLPAAGPGERIAVKVRIPTGREVSGTIVDQEGKPLAGATVFLTDQSMRGRMRSSVDRIDQQRCYTVTDAEGRFELVMPELQAPVSLYVQMIENGRTVANLNQVLDIDEGSVGLRVEVPVQGRQGGRPAAPTPVQTPSKR